MLYHRINRASETLTLLMVALWGNWAIYYWVMVIGLNASYSDLKAGLPVLLAQTGATMLILLRQDLGFADPLGESALPPASRMRIAHRSLLLPILFSLTMTGIALAVWALGWSKSPLGYNLLWGLMTPLALILYLRRRPGDCRVGQDEPPDRNLAYQIIDLVGLVAAFFIVLTVANLKGFPTPDDAFYAHIMSSTLAHPGLPVQGQDLLFGTSAPYSLHPGYRVSGYEVLAALISDLTSTDPLWVYYELYPLLGYLLWILVAHLFLRSLRIPYPGIGVLIALLVLLHFHGIKSHGRWFLAIYMGKGQVSANLAPLLFAVTASFCRRPTGNTWLLLLLSVCAVGAWSSSSLFIVPVALALATAVHLPIRRRSLPGLTLIGATTIPILLLLGVTLQVAAQVPPNTEGSGTGLILVAGQAFGGASAKALLFVTLLALPAVAATSRDPSLHSRLARFALVGALSVYAPYWIELLAEQSGMYLLSWRMQWAFPSALIAGILGALVTSRLAQALRATRTVALRNSVALLLASGVWTAAFLGTSERPLAFGSRQAWIVQLRESAEEALQEARDARALIPDKAYVAAGHLHELLPMLPNPPVFVSVRHYLGYHRNVMEPSELRQRSYIQRMTDDLTPPAGKDPESVARFVVRTARKLGVSTFVYRTAPEPGAEPGHGTRAEFVGLLTQELEGASYRCETTPSGETRVCNSVPPK